jgi:hypothetical protein
MQHLCALVIATRAADSGLYSRLWIWMKIVIIVPSFLINGFMSILVPALKNVEAKLREFRLEEEEVEEISSSHGQWHCKGIVDADISKCFDATCIQFAVPMHLTLLDTNGRKHR